jgi:hypothetical protein
MTINHQLSHHAKIIKVSGDNEPFLTLMLPQAFGGQLLIVEGGELLAEFSAGDLLLLFTLADFGGEDTLYIYLIDPQGRIAERIELFSAYTDCKLQIWDEGTWIRFSFFTESHEYWLRVMEKPKIQILPWLTGVKRAGRIMLHSRLVLKEVRRDDGGPSWT